jgi:hypothetical protein
VLTVDRHGNPGYWSDPHSLAFKNINSATSPATLLAWFVHCAEFILGRVHAEITESAPCSLRAGRTVISTS